MFIQMRSFALLCAVSRCCVKDVRMFYYTVSAKNVKEGFRM